MRKRHVRQSRNGRQNHLQNNRDPSSHRRRIHPRRSRSITRNRRRCGRDSFCRGSHLCRIRLFRREIRISFSYSALVGRRRGCSTAARTAKQRKQYHARKKGIEVPGNHFEKPSKNRQTPRKHIKKPPLHTQKRVATATFFISVYCFLPPDFSSLLCRFCFSGASDAKNASVFLFCASFYTQFFAYFLLIFYAATRFALFVIRFRDSSGTARESSGSAR